MFSKLIPQVGANLIKLAPDLLHACISRFLINFVRLVSLDPQTQIKRRENNEPKWSLKNYEKWAKTERVGARVEGTPFRPMKVMRQSDAAHNPAMYGRFVC